MDKSTKAISRYLNENGITIKHVSEKTGIPYYLLYQSLSSSRGNRELKGDELLKVCELLKLEPTKLLENQRSN